VPNDGHVHHENESETKRVKLKSDKGQRSQKARRTLT